MEEHAEHIMFGRAGVTLLVPIPLSRERIKERGYNQTEKIAEALSTMADSASFTLETKALIKIRHTQPQMSVSDKKKRLEHLTGAFSVPNPSLVIGRDIVLIDDVTTTGATITEARKTLLRAGARQVTAYVIAH